jgi:transcriptional regulator with XRE-family HTH domain
MSNEQSGKRVSGVKHGAVLARQMKDPEFRSHYLQRKLVHEVAVAVRAMRKQAKLTQAQLAAEVGVSQPMIAKIEKGIEQRAPNWEMLGKVCVALGKQMRLSFRDVEEDAETHLVEVDGKPASAFEEAAGAEAQ